MRNSYASPIRQMLLKSVFKKAMVYLSIAFLEIMLLTPVYAMVYRETRKTERAHIESDATANLRIFSGDMDALNQYIYALMSNESITYLAHIPDVNGLHTAKILELNNEVSRSTILHSACLDDLVIQFKNSRYLIAGGNIVQRSQYYGSSLTYENYDQEAYEDLLFNQRARTIPMQKISTIRLGSQRAVTFNYFSRSSSNSQYVISAIISENTLIEALVPEAVRNYGFFRLTYADGSELLSIGEQTEAMDTFAALTDESATFHVVYGVDKAVYQENVQGVQMLILAYCSLALVVGALYCGVLAARSMRSFRPVAEMLEAVSVPEMADTLSARSVDAFVNQMLQKQLVRMDEMQESLHEIQERYQDEMIFSLLRGNAQLDAADLMELRNLPVFQNAYQVAEICLADDNIATIYMKEEAMKLAEKLLREKIPAMRIVCFMPLLAVLPADVEDSLLDTVCAEIGRQIAPVGVALSAVHSGIDALPTAYAQTRMVRRNKHLFLQEGGVMRYAALSARLEDSSALNLDLSDGGAFSRLIVQGPSQELEEQLREMNRHLEHLALTRPQRLSASYYNIIAVLEAFYRSLQTPKQLMEYDPEMPVSQIQRYIWDTTMDIAQRMMERREKIEPHDGIVQYVTDHYAESGMNLSHLSSQFGLSEAYISRIIKRCTGMNYTEFLESLRMKKAEELLFTTSLSVGEISAQLGYDNQNTFFKAFKRHYQVSPGAYRENPPVR